MKRHIKIICILIILGLIYYIFLLIGRGRDAIYKTKVSISKQNSINLINAFEYYYAFSNSIDEHDYDNITCVFENKNVSNRCKKLVEEVSKRQKIVIPDDGQLIIKNGMVVKDTCLTYDKITCIYDGSKCNMN